MFFLLAITEDQEEKVTLATGEDSSKVKDLEPSKELGEFQFKLMKANYFVQKVQLRDSSEEHFDLDTRNEDDSGSGEVSVMTPLPDPQTDQILPLWALAAVAGAGLVLLACCICCPLILYLRSRRAKRGSFKLEQREF